VCAAEFAGFLWFLHTSLTHSALEAVGYTILSSIGLVMLGAMLAAGFDTIKRTS
jgi:hypothetical protein